jgi:3-deoxy-D-manno-octulosonic-acid transferase
MMLYTIAIHLYALAVELLAPFHRKARMMRAGQRKTGRILREHIDRNARYIWFHASSLGEFEQGRPLMETVKARCPDCRILLTFFSPSGYEVRKNYPGADVVCYLPFDTPRRVRTFLRLAKPCMAIFIKYEFWANYLFELKKRQIPVYSISAVFRPGQWFFKWYGRPYLKALRCFDRLFVQDAPSAGLLAGCGIEAVTLSGDTRFDRVTEVHRKASPIRIVEAFVKNGQGEKRPTLVAGSSWPGDEELIIRYFNERPDLKLIIAPHEIDRGHLQEIRSRLKRPSVLFSEAREGVMAQYDCLIVDCFGLLSSIYRYGDIAYVGGGFGKGIHNILEAAVYGIPVLFGPVYHKFREAKDLIAAGGGVSVPDGERFQAQMDEWLGNPALLQAAGEAAGAFVRSRTGATETIWQRLAPLICKAER